jgi:uncharacterized phage protein (TIGR01671 family)
VPVPTEQRALTLETLTNSHMRTIKFRAWDKRIEQMLKITAIEFNGSGAKRLKTLERLAIKHNHYSVPTQFVMAESVNLMQFTGLLDKNGKEIYEGDILQTPTSNYDPSNGDSPYTLETVEWKRSGWYLDYELADYEQNEIEVIGNIYENEELLKN